MEISTVGLDLAKSIFQVHAIDEAGEVVIRKALRRSQVLPFFAKRAQQSARAVRFTQVSPKLCAQVRLQDSMCPTKNKTKSNDWRDENGGRGKD